MNLELALKMLFTKVRSTREEQEPNQRAFAITTGISKNHYSRLECHGYNCTLYSFLKICIHLRLKPWQLLEIALGPVWDELCEKELKK